MKLSLLVFLFSWRVEATFLPRFEAPVQKISNALDFVAPNEVYPHNAMPIVSDAPQGVYVSVGTERGIMGAILNLSATHLLFVDSNPNVVIFNQINSLLLRLSRDRRDYFFLRFGSRHEEWILRARQAGLEDREQSIVGNAAFFNWWRKRVVSSDFSFLNESSGSRRPFFQTTNYLRSDFAFRRIHWLAKNNRIAVVRIDLSDRSKFHAIIKELDRQKIKLSVLDISNAWGPPFLNIRQLLVLLREFKFIAHSSSVMMLTGGSSQSDDLWSYIGFTFKRIQNLTTSGALFRYLNSKIKNRDPIRFFDLEDENRLDPPGFMRIAEHSESPPNFFAKLASWWAGEIFWSESVGLCAHLF